ncbi:MAG: helix-turn-helix transcriptional regulator [Deltaproteobacteria bacterium]|nr:helix-turn-helix transcriptional regulator [Deltaproteobacteria bacterium]
MTEIDKQALPPHEITECERETVVRMYSAPFTITLRVGAKPLGRKTRRTFTLALIMAMRPHLSALLSGAIHDTDQPQMRNPDRYALSLHEALEIGTPASELGYRIRQARLALKLSQTGLAALVNVDRTHLSRIERGIHYPQVRTLKRIELALNCVLVPKRHNANGEESSKKNRRPRGDGRPVIERKHYGLFPFRSF